MLKADKCRLKRLAWNHAAYCRCPLGDPGCKCTKFQVAGFERLFQELHDEMIRRGKIAIDQ